MIIAASAPRTAAPPDASAPAPKHWDAPPPMELKPKTSYTASVKTPDGVLGVQLLPGAGPNAVNNFVFLARQGFYKDSPVHRMIPDFMMQTGDPTGTGTGDAGYKIEDDPVPTGAKYVKGVVAMANAGPSTGGSQFFVMLKDTPLPPNYSIFGYVTAGQDVLDKIATRTVEDNGQGEQSKPVEPFALDDVTIQETPVA